MYQVSNRYKRNAFLLAVIFCMAIQSCSSGSDGDEKETPSVSSASEPESQGKNDSERQGENGNENKDSDLHDESDDKGEGDFEQIEDSDEPEPSSPVATEKRTLIASKAGKISAEKYISATIDGDGVAAIQNADISRAFNAAFTVTLYKAESASTTTYIADVNLDSSSVVANISSQGYEDAKTVDVSQYFDATESLKNMATDLSVADVDMESVKASAQNVLSSMLVENGISDGVTIDKITTSVANPTISCKYDYESDIANATFNLNFADLKEIYKGKFTTAEEYTGIGVPNDLITNTDETYDQFDEIISGVKMHYHPYDTDLSNSPNWDYTHQLRAVEFDNSIKNVDIDYANGTYDFSDVYKGGFITGNETNVSYSNMDGATFDGYVNFHMYGTDNKFINHLKTSSEHPTLNVILGHTQPNINLYGYGLEKIIDNYYGSNVGNKLSNLSIDVDDRFDAKDYLNGEHMFDDNGYKNNAYTLSTNAALTMSYNGIRLANVKISGERKSTAPNRFRAEMYNIYSEADLSATTSTGCEYGMLYFANKPPSCKIGSSYSKVVLADDTAYNSKATYYGRKSYIDISKLSLAHQNETAKVSDQKVSIYFSEAYRTSSFSPKYPPNASMFFFGNTGYMLGPITYGDGYAWDYTNESIEDLGNAMLEDSNEALNNASKYLKERNLGRKLVSRADTTKTLSPVEKLLLKEQHIYG